VLLEYDFAALAGDQRMALFPLDLIKRAHSGLGKIARYRQPSLLRLPIEALSMVGASGYGLGFSRCVV
jgi:hypothetical protein